MKKMFAIFTDDYEPRLIDVRTSEDDAKTICSKSYFLFYDEVPLDGLPIAKPGESLWRVEWNKKGKVRVSETDAGLSYPIVPLLWCGEIIVGVTAYNKEDAIEKATNLVVEWFDTKKEEIKNVKTRKEGY